jgi:hypothetical protein
VRGTNVAGTNHVPKRSLVIVQRHAGPQLRRAGGGPGGLQHLKHQHHEVLLFHVLTGPEADFDFTERPPIFEDIERALKSSCSLPR